MLEIKLQDTGNSPTEQTLQPPPSQEDSSDRDSVESGVPAWNGQRVERAERPRSAKAL